MSISIKFGTITQVSRSKQTTYTVKIDGGNLIEITQEQIKPLQAEILKRGSRLSIGFDNGKIVEVSTDLRSPSKRSDETARHQTSGNITPGIYLATVTNFERSQGIVSLTIRGGPKVKIRLPQNHPDWKIIYWGKKFDLEVSLDAQGNTRYALISESTDKGKTAHRPSEGLQDTQTSQRKPGPEIRSGVVTHIELSSGTVTLATNSGESIKIQIPFNHSDWQRIFLGHEYELKQITTQGFTKYTLVISDRPLHESITQPQEPTQEKSPSYTPELQVVTLTNIDQTSGLITVLTDQKKNIIIRLPKDSPEWSNLIVGSQYQLKTYLDVSGKLRFAFIVDRPAEYQTRPSQESEQDLTGLVIGKPEESHETGGERDSKSSKQTGSEQRTEAERIGIDPQYFQERERENHRFEIMHFLREHLEDDLIEWYKMRPSQEARYGSPNKPLHHAVETTIRESDAGFKEFYIHQARALDSIRAGRNLIIVTQTASGKTLCYNPAIFEHFGTIDPSAHALYIFPLNALMYDQNEKVDTLRLGLHDKNFVITSDHLKGGRGTEGRAELSRDNPNILAINPEMLSVILNESSRWRGFFTNLRYVVVDEVHSYRGILGMHMAGILRRLLLTARRYGSEPQYILSSATVSNPADLAVRLTSLPVESFDILTEKDDGSGQNYKHWISLNPDVQEIGNGYDNYLLTAALVMVELLCGVDPNNRTSSLNTILFAKSIRDVNKVYKIVQDNLQTQRPDLAKKVRKFVSAELGPDEKREIYQKLKSGQLIGVVSTNALEAGIDIGKLDACIIAGFPFSVMRMRQMAGRVGRQQEGLVVFVPHPINPLDQYYRNNPDLLLTQPPEVFVVDPENPYVARKHINAAAYELRGISHNELKVFGSSATQTIRQAIADRVIANYGDNYFGKNRGYKDPLDPYAIVGLRSQNQTPYLLCQNNGGRCDRSESCFHPDNKNGCHDRIAVLDQQYAYRDCHPGAIYESADGALYRVTFFDDRNRVIRAEPLPDGFQDRTFVEENTTINILGEPTSFRYFSENIILEIGKVLVTRSFTGYYTYNLIPKRICRRCKIVYDQNEARCSHCGRATTQFFDQSKPGRLDFPEPYEAISYDIKLETVACWLTMAAEIENNLADASPCKLPGEKNRVHEFLKHPLKINHLINKHHLLPDEIQIIEQYHLDAGQEINDFPENETFLLPGIYRQCLMSSLRETLTESRALEVYQALTDYPVTDELKHVCRNCQTSVLMPAMHTLEHTVSMRYPSVALGDLGDIAAHTFLGHPDTGAPTIFWYDNYQGGLGAADKIFERINDLLGASEKTISNCTCSTIEGCPHCTQIGNCDQRNDALSKPAALLLLRLFLNIPDPISYQPYRYPKKKNAAFDETYTEKEYSHYEHGRGEEAPAGATKEETFDPFILLRIQPKFHTPVLKKAYEVRSLEITNEVPPVSAVQLNQAYKLANEIQNLREWNILAGMTPYEILEIQTTASQQMIHHIYRVIARQVHPDTYQGDKQKANEMMKLVNKAYEQILDDKRNNN